MTKPILILYPPFEGKNYLKSRAPFPVGPLYLAAYLKAQGFIAKVKDFSWPPEKHKVPRPKQLKTKQPNYFRFGWRDVAILIWLKRNLKKYHSIVGVSSLMSSNWSGGYRLIELIKKANSETIIIIGGPHATAFPDHVYKYTNADYICIGEGEDSFLNFLKGIPDEGIITPGSTTNIRTAFIQDLDKLPFPKRSMLMDDRKIKEMYVSFSRGCPHKCSFCGSYLIQGRKWRNKSVGRIIKELNHYYHKWGIRNFTVEDDNPCPGPKGIRHLKEVCKHIIKEVPKIKLIVSHGIPVYAVADKELADLLYEAGFRRMVLPLESTDPNVLKDMNKDTVTNWEKAIKNWTYETAVPSETIIGYPFVETIETMLKTMIDVANMKSRVWASHFRLNKGTPLFDRCLKAGYITDDYDPINTQSFYIETERFKINDLKELMQISRGINYAIERGFNPFKEVVDSSDFTEFSIPKKIGDVVAKGKFKFKRAQNICASIMLTITGKFDERPFVTYENDHLIYKGNRPSIVYDTLRYIITGKKKQTIRNYL